MLEVTIERQQQVQVAYIAAMVVVVIITKAFLELIELAEHFVIGSLVVEIG